MYIRFFILSPLVLWCASSSKNFLWSGNAYVITMNRKTYCVYTWVRFRPVLSALKYCLKVPLAERRTFDLAELLLLQQHRMFCTFDAPTVEVSKVSRHCLLLPPPPLYGDFVVENNFPLHYWIWICMFLSEFCYYNECIHLVFGFEKKISFKEMFFFF